jgi:hypothetical protein
VEPPSAPRPPRSESANLHSTICTLKWPVAPRTSGIARRIAGDSRLTMEETGWKSRNSRRPFAPRFGRPQPVTRNTDVFLFPPPSSVFVPHSSPTGCTSPSNSPPAEWICPRFSPAHHHLGQTDHLVMPRIDIAQNMRVSISTPYFTLTTRTDLLCASSGLTKYTPGENFSPTRSPRQAPVHFPEMS